MEKYDKSMVDRMPEKERLEIIQRILRSQIVRKKRINGTAYYENIEAGENFYISEELNDFIRELIYTKLDDDMKNKDEDEYAFLATFTIIMKRFYSKDKVDETLKKLSDEDLKVIFINYNESLKQNGIDIFEYIPAENLYSELKEDIQISEEIKLESDEMAILYEAKKACVDRMNKQIEKSDSIEEWTRNGGQKKYRKEYATDVLLEKMSDEDISHEEKEDYANTLLNLGLNPKKIGDKIQSKEITPILLRELYNTEALKPVIISAVGKLRFFNVMVSFLTIKETDVLNEVNWNKITVEEYKEVEEKIPEVTSSIFALTIMKEYSLTGKKMPEAEIAEILECAGTYQMDKIRAYFELAKQGLYRDDKIFDLYEEGKDITYFDENKDRVKSVTVDELLDYFNVDKVIEKETAYINSEKSDEDKKSEKKFMTFYISLLYANETEGTQKNEEIMEELKEKLKANMENNSKETILIAMNLFNRAILSKEDLNQIITKENEDIIIDLYGKELDDNYVIGLYFLGIISNDIMDLLYNDDATGLNSKIKEGKISSENAMQLYFNGIIDMECFKGINIDVEWEIACNGIEKEVISNKIAELYRNNIIDFEQIKKLKETNLLSAKDAEWILSQINLEEILANGLVSEEGIGEKGRRKNHEPGSRKSVIPLEEREELLNELGFFAMTNSNGETLAVSGGSFKGYRVYREKDRKYGVIVFESERDGSSFIMHEAKAGEFIRKDDDENAIMGSRSEWREKARTDGSVIAKLHSVQWGKNLISAIVETSSTFKFDDEKERTDYIKSETKELKNEYDYLIKYYAMLKRDSLKR